MFSNFAWSEMLVIACVAILVVGPKELPGMLRAFGKTLGKVKRMAREFQSQVDDAVREAELDDIKDIASKGLNPVGEIKSQFEDVAKSVQDPMKSVKEDIAENLDELEAPAVAEPAPIEKKQESKKTTAKKPAAKQTTSKRAATSKTTTRAAKTAPKTATKSTSTKTTTRKPAARKTTATKAAKTKA